MSWSTRGTTVQQLNSTNVPPSCTARANLQKKNNILGLWSDNAPFSSKGLENPDLCLVRVRIPIWVPSGRCINSQSTFSHLISNTFSHHSPCKVTFLCRVKLSYLPVGCRCLKWRRSSSQTAKRSNQGSAEVTLSCFHTQDFIFPRTTRMLMLNVPSRWSSIPPKCISVIGENLCSATSRTIHQDFFFQSRFSGHALNEQNRTKRQACLSRITVPSDLLLFHPVGKYKGQSGSLFLLFHSCLLTKT